MVLSKVNGSGYLVRASIWKASRRNDGYPSPQIFEGISFIFLPILPCLRSRESRVTSLDSPLLEAKHSADASRFANYLPTTNENTWNEQFSGKILSARHR